MLKFREGQPASFPPRVLFHLVAARYGTTPAAVREWPADDFATACELLGISS